MTALALCSMDDIDTLDQEEDEIVDRAVRVGLHALMSIIQDEDATNAERLWGIEAIFKYAEVSYPLE